MAEQDQIGESENANANIAQGGVAFLAREAAFALLEDESNRLCFELRFCADKWLDILGIGSFKTQLVVIPPEAAKAVILKHILVDPMKFESDKHEAEAELKKPDENGKKLEEFLDELEILLDSTIKEFPNGQSFIKSPLRSPKDSPLRKELGDMEKNLLSDALENVEKGNYVGELVAFQQCLTRLLQIRSGREAIELLTSSARIHRDFTRLLDHDNFEKDSKTELHQCDQSKDSHIYLVLREYVPIVSSYPQLEFRGFVRHRNLVGLSQYNTFARFEFLHEYREVIFGAICRVFAAHIAPNLSDELQDAVIDFFIMPQGRHLSQLGTLSEKEEAPPGGWLDKESGMSVWALELNPYFRYTGACLYSWEHDKKILFSESVEGNVENVENENAKKVDDEDNIVIDPENEKDVKSSTEKVEEVAENNPTNTPHSLPYIHPQCELRLVDTDPHEGFDLLMSMIPPEWLGTLGNIQGYTTEDFEPPTTQSTAPQKKDKCSML